VYDNSKTQENVVRDSLMYQAESGHRIPASKVRSFSRVTRLEYARTLYLGIEVISFWYLLKTENYSVAILVSLTFKKKNIVCRTRNVNSLQDQRREPHDYHDLKFTNSVQSEVVVPFHFNNRTCPIVALSCYIRTSKSVSCVVNSSLYSSPEACKIL
jgi:hypothetical protein